MVIFIAKFARFFVFSTQICCRAPGSPKEIFLSSPQEMSDVSGSREYFTRMPESTEP